MHNLATTIASFATNRKFSERTVLLHQGDRPKMAYVVKSGIVKMYTINAAGEEQVLAFLCNDDFFPATWVLGKTQVALYYYEAVTDCEIATLERNTLRNILYKPEHLQALVDYLVNNYSGLSMRVTALEQSRANEKILLTLYYLLFRHGVRQKGTQYIINLPLTHQVIASMLGLTRETATNELGKLKSQGILHHENKVYTIDKQKLEQALGEDSFKDFVS
jgi:CRP/FNR family transcriptional regulator